MEREIAEIKTKLEEKKELEDLIRDGEIRVDPLDLVPWPSNSRLAWMKEMVGVACRLLETLKGTGEGEVCSLGHWLGVESVRLTDSVPEHTA